MVWCCQHVRWYNTAALRGEWEKRFWWSIFQVWKVSLCLESFPLRASVVLGAQVPLIDWLPAQTVSLRALLGLVLTAWTEIYIVHLLKKFYFYFKKHLAGQIKSYGGPALNKRTHFGIPESIDMCCCPLYLDLGSWMKTSKINWLILSVILQA